MYTAVSSSKTASPHWYTVSKNTSHIYFWLPPKLFGQAACAAKGCCCPCVPMAPAYSVHYGLLRVEEKLPPWQRAAALSSSSLSSHSCLLPGRTGRSTSSSSPRTTATLDSTTSPPWERCCLRGGEISTPAWGPHTSPLLQTMDLNTSSQAADASSAPRDWYLPKFLLAVSWIVSFVLLHGYATLMILSHFFFLTAGCEQRKGNRFCCGALLIIMFHGG